jgi:hypothetical protein
MAGAAIEIARIKEAETSRCGFLNLQLLISVATKPTGFAPGMQVALSCVIPTFRDLDET